MFKKVAVFTDIHLGKRSDSEQHNQDCLRYIKWFCKQARKHKCDTVIFMGDFFENRSKIGSLTLHYAHLVISELNSLGLPIYWISGNHDMYYRHKRDIVSVSFVEAYSNVTLINEITEIDGVLLSPFLVSGEYAIPPDREVKYVFGHFELPHFLLNEMVEMPDRGGLHADHFYQCEMVFSGHFHKRQLKTNSEGIPIWYIGNTFPMDFNDANDRERGMMILEWDQEPQFLDWPEAPNYNRIKLSTLVDLIEEDKLEERFNQYSVIDCKDDLNTDLEDIVEIREALAEIVRDIQIRQAQSEIDVSEEVELEQDQEEKTLDSLVADHLRKLDTRGEDIDTELLVSLFRGETVDGKVQ